MIASRIQSRWNVAICGGLLVWLTLAAPAWAHIEAAEAGADVIWERTSAKVVIRLAVRELINAEQPLDAVVLPDYNQDPSEVTKRNAEYILRGFHIKYDGKELTPRMVKTDVQSLVIGVSEEDIVPRQCSVYEMEFTGGEKPAGPSRIDMSMTLFTLPPDAGFQPTVLCLITHTLDGTDKTRTVVIGHEDSLTIRPTWPSQPAPLAATDVTPAASSATPRAAAAPVVHKRGPLIVLGLGIVVGIALVVVLARKRA
jgi:hypothetical protein